jgi:hypothetical protein
MINALKNADLGLLRIMRTRGHHPAAEKAAQVIARSGDNGYLWIAIGTAGFLKRLTTAGWALYGRYVGSPAS